MQSDTFAPLLIGGLVAAAIVAGLMVTGGPIAARAEKRDMARLADLRELQSFVTCRYDLDDALPDTLATDERCADTLPMTDPVTDAPYVYEKTSATSYRLCATFERPELVEDYDLGPGQWQSDRGCFLLTQK